MTTKATVPCKIPRHYFDKTGKFKPASSVDQTPYINLFFDVDNYDGVPAELLFDEQPMKPAEVLRALVDGMDSLPEAAIIYNEYTMNFLPEIVRQARLLKEQGHL